MTVLWVFLAFWAGWVVRSYWRAPVEDWLEAAREERDAVAFAVPPAAEATDDVTPAEHEAEAERWLYEAGHANRADVTMAHGQMAAAHALVAISKRMAPRPIPRTGP